MDKTTAQAIHELATTGRLSDETASTVDEVLGHDKADDDQDKSAAPAAAHKGSTRN